MRNSAHFLRRSFLTRGGGSASVQPRSLQLHGLAACEEVGGLHPGGAQAKKRGATMARLLRSAALFAALVVLWPTAAQAQASLAGAVKDASGAVLPGVP